MSHKLLLLEISSYNLRFVVPPQSTIIYLLDSVVRASPLRTVPTIRRSICGGNNSLLLLLCFVVVAVLLLLLPFPLRLLAPVLFQRGLENVLARHDSNPRRDGQIQERRRPRASKGLPHTNRAQKGLVVHAHDTDDDGGDDDDDETDDERLALEVGYDCARS